MWKKAKNGLFSVNSSFDTLKGGRTVSFPKRMIWNQCDSTKMVLFLVFYLFIFLCLGSMVGQNNDLGPAQEERSFLGQ